MKPDQEQSMRSGLAEYAKGELIDLAISLQDVCNDHMKKIEGLQTSVNTMGKQIPILQGELDKYEGGPPVDHEEVVTLQEEISALKLRNDDLQQLNEGLQRKLIG
jgi:hypothetical protein